MELIKSIYKFVKLIIETNNKIPKLNTYDRVINNPIDINK